MKYISWIIVIFLIGGLIGVRVLESKLFYDPFLGYFKDSSSSFPLFEWSTLILSHFFRFFLNFVFSIGIIYFLFQNKKWMIQAGILICLSFVLFFPIYIYCLYTEFEFGKLFAFYIRRIVIHPIPLLIIIPIFYYNNKK